MREDVLKIEFHPVFDKWAWRITYQNEDVLKRGEFYDEDLKTESHSLSELVDGFLFIRGAFREQDEKINFCTIEEKTIIEEKVKLINEKYGVLKLWRAEKNVKYYFVEINQNAKIILTAESSRYLDDERYKIGNYFKTRKLAEKYLSDLKEFSRKWHEKNGADGRNEQIL
jgi:hypothetical protein